MPNTNIQQLLRDIRQRDEGCTREFTVQLDTLNEEARTVELACSSEYPVQRWYGTEILEHSASAIRMDRMRNGAPLLNQHRGGEQIGVIVEFRLDKDKRTRALVKFSRGKQGDEIFTDVKDGIRSHVSIGYLVHDMVLTRSSDDGDEYRITDWEPYEASMVSIPADPTVGVGRSSNLHKGAQSMTGETNQPAAGTDNPQPATQQRSQERANQPAPAPVQVNESEIEARERTRISELIAIGDKFNMRDLANTAISAGTSVNAFRAQIMETMNPQPSGTGTRADDGLRPDVAAIGITARDLQGYSLMNVVRALADKTGSAWKKAGREREISLAIADAVGKEARGFYIPHALLAQRLLMTGERAGVGLSKTATKGEELVALDLLDQEFIDVLRNKALLGQLGARAMTGLVGDADIPKKTAGSNFYWLSGETDDEVTDSEIDLTTLPLRPKTVAGSVPVSRRMLKQSSMSMEAFIIQDLVEGLAVEIDRQAMVGTGVGNLPVGILNRAGVNASVIPAGGIDWPTLVEMETKISSANADVSAMHYLTSSVQRGVAKTSEKAAGYPVYLWDETSNMINGYTGHVSNNVPANTWLFGDFSQMVMGFWGVLDIKPDDAAKAASGGLVLRVFQDLDIQCRRPEAFTVAQPA